MNQLPVAWFAGSAGAPNFLCKSLSRLEPSPKLLGNVLKESNVPVKIFGAKDTSHVELNDDLGLPNDLATKALYEFLARALKD